LPDEATRPWQLLDSRELRSGRRATLYSNTYRLPDGSTRPDYLIVDERGGTLVVAITDDEKLVLVGQYRAPVEEFGWELPAGALEADESDPRARAESELREETGFHAREWHDAGTLFAAPHRSTETDTCFLALGARRTEGQDLDPGESVSVRLVPLADVPALIERGEMRSAVSIAALYKALRLRERLLTNV
jgi:8-oxo-dGTP pyrophosphatase MutT (NUDIX family)